MTREDNHSQKLREHQLLWEGCTTEAHRVLRKKVKGSKKGIKNNIKKVIQRKVRKVYHGEGVDILEIPRS